MMICAHPGCSRGVIVEGAGFGGVGRKTNYLCDEHLPPRRPVQSCKCGGPSYRDRDDARRCVTCAKVKVAA